VCESVVRVIVSNNVSTLKSILGGNDGHESVYSWEWLRSWRGSFRTSAADFDETIRWVDGSWTYLVRAENTLRHWQHVDPSRPDLFPTVHFEEIMKSDIGVADWTKRIVRLPLPTTPFLPLINILVCLLV
jgi:hypothetical protein